MSPGFSLFAFLIVSVLNLTFADDDDGHHHHVIIHVPYKVHTIHHTITKHIHHHDKGGEDKYEVIGYTVGKPLDYGHHLGGGGDEHHHQLFQYHQPQQEHHDLGGGDHMLHQHHQHQEEEQEFAGGNELGHGHDWMPSLGHHNHYPPPSHEYVARRSGYHHGYD